MEPQYAILSTPETATYQRWLFVAFLINVPTKVVMML